MRNKDPVFWAALRLHRMLSQASEHVDDLAFRATTAVYDIRAAERLARMLAAADSRAWRGAAATLRERLLAAAGRVQSGCAELRRPRPLPPRPSLAELSAELRQLHDEFEHVEVRPRESRICVVTDAITLEDVPLGPFSIELCLARLSTHLDASAFEVVAKDPNPAAGSSDSAHPHVSGSSLCAGEATVPIATALTEGRIADAFCLVSAVLHTYNPASAYVSLSEWNGGVTCCDCGRSCHGDDVYYCDGCGSDYCDSCISCCDRCDRSLCLGCLEQDEKQGDRVCRSCRRNCRRCGTAGDGARLRRQRGLCDDCLADEAPEEDDDEVAADDEPAGQGVLAVSTDQLTHTELPSHEPEHEEPSRPTDTPDAPGPAPDAAAPSCGEADRASDAVVAASSLASSVAVG
jgi:hypothetical protein